MRAWRHRRSRRSGWVSSAGRPQLPSRDALAGLSPLLRDELPPLPGTPAVHRMRSQNAQVPGSTTDQSGAVGRCVHIQPPGQDHRWLGRRPSSRGHSCQLVAVLSLEVGSNVGYSWWQGHRVGCGRAGDSARGDRSRSSPLVEEGSRAGWVGGRSTLGQQGCGGGLAFALLATAHA